VTSNICITFVLRYCAIKVLTILIIYYQIDLFIYLSFHFVLSMIILCYSFIYHITCYSFTLYHCIIPLNSNALYANFWIVDYNVSGTTVRNGSTVKFILPSFHFTEWLVCFNNLQSYCTNYLKRCYLYYRELIKVHRSLMSQRIFTASSISAPSKENSIMVMFSASLLHKNESGSGIIVCTHWYMCKDIIIFLYELICEKVIYIYIYWHMHRYEILYQHAQ